MLPVPTNFEPCCDQIPFDLVNIQVAPSKLLSPKPPAAKVLPSADKETEDPCPADPEFPVPTNLLPCCVSTNHVKLFVVSCHVSPLKIKIAFFGVGFCKINEPTFVFICIGPTASLF